MSHNQHMTILPFIYKMPPKKLRKAKPGAILSGISQVGPGKVEIESMVSHSLHIVTNSIKVVPRPSEPFTSACCPC